MPADAELPVVPSAYAGRQLTVREHLNLSAYWFGSNFVWGALLGPVLAQQMTKLAPQTTAQTLGSLYTLGALPALFVPLLVGPLSDRCTSKFGRRRPFLLTGGLIALLGLLLMLGASLRNVLPGFFIGYFALQLGSNTALGAYSGVIPDHVPPDQRGFASGIMAFMSQVGTLCGAVSTGRLIEANQLGLVYGIMIVIFTIFLAASIFGIHEHPLTGVVPKLELGPYLKSLWIDPRMYPDFAWVWITRALMMLGFYAIQPYILYYLRDVVNVAKPAQDAALLVGVILVGATISGVVGGKISDRTGRKPVVYFSSLVISVMAIAFIFCRDLWQVGVVGVLFGIGYGAYVSVDWALGTDVLPDKQHAGKDMAVWHVAMTLPQQIAPLIAGQILSVFVLSKTPVAKYAIGGYALIFSLAAGCFLLGALLLRNVRGAR